MTGKFDIELYNRSVYYHLSVKRNITILRGDSGTGKTKLISLLESLQRKGMSSGITLICDRPCYVVTVDMWQYHMTNKKDYIIFIDEGNAFVRTEEFANLVKNSSNYYVIVTREPLPMLPYSVHEIYGLRECNNKYPSIKQTYNEMYLMYGSYTSNIKVSPKMIITEDSNSGYEFFKYISDKLGILCESAYGNSNVCARAINLSKGVSGYIALIVDAAAYGPYVEDVVKYLNDYPNAILLLPESFEYLILSSGTLKDVPRDILDNTSKYVESSEYFSWERFFTAMLIDMTKGTSQSYSKNSLNMFYLSDVSISKILEQLPNLDLSKGE